MSITGTIMAFVGLAAVKRPSERDQEREEMLEHLAYLEAEAIVVKAERDRFRAERDHLLAGARRCQWQAQLNRAMEVEQQAQLHAAQAQMYAQRNAFNAECGLACNDCNMYRAEQGLGQLYAPGQLQGLLGQGLLGQGLIPPGGLGLGPQVP